MIRPNSPIFPPQQLTINTQMSQPSPLDQVDAGDSIVENQSALLPQLPEKPTCSTSSIQVYIIPTEQNLFVEGFDAQEYSSRPPTLLRGCLYLRVIKPVKIKSITLTFKGIQRTEWPEGIPPKKQLYAEVNDIVSHTWPFYPSGNLNNGADYFVESGNHRRLLSSSFNDLKRLNSNSSDSSISSSSVAESALTGGGASVVNFLSRNLSPGFIRNRGKSPSVSSIDMPPDLSAMISPGGSITDVNNVFTPGDYIYNFEHPLPPSIPESTNVTFGTTNYNMEVSIIRAGAFKSNLSGKIPINIIRTPAESNMEENESIVITRDWEDQLRYDIVIGSKSIVLDSYLPLAFRFVPLFGKVCLHRIRVYLSENLEYYCSNKRVHRMEPPKKFLLLEHKAKKGRSLLSSRANEEVTEEDNEDFFEDILPKELEFQLYVPSELSSKFQSKIHPDTSYENIQSHHWIKICLRISKPDPSNPEKRKHYEISIDSPIHVLSPLAAHGNTLLPAYDDFIPTLQDPLLSPGVTPVEETTTGIEFHHISTTTDLDGIAQESNDMHLSANLYHPNTQDESIVRAMNSPQASPHPHTFISRPIHMLRKPSVNPPPFDADVSPPGIDHHIMNGFPPAYEEDERDNADDDVSPLRMSVPIRQQLARSGNFELNGRSPIREQLRRGNRNSSSTQSSSSSQGQTSEGSSLHTASEGSEPPQHPPMYTSTTDSARQTPQIILNNEEDITGGSPRTSQDVQTQDVPTSQDTPTSSDEPTSQDTPHIAESTSQGLQVEEQDITDDPSSPIFPPDRYDRRHSSINSIELDQTMPLLDLSACNTEPEEQQEEDTRGSVTSSIFDLSYRRPVVQPVKIIGFIDEHSSYDEMNHSLQQLRNPRINRHYQDDAQEEQVKEGGSSDRDVTEIPGFKVGFVIDGGE
ncbi:Arrestin-related trafficking adapter 3 [Spathaspora sp. JA1]|nr:Arrestin-related trafficking adapter 3 [Spathaspora sp. JA1]